MVKRSELNKLKKKYHVGGLVLTGIVLFITNFGFITQILLSMIILLLSRYMYHRIEVSHLGNIEEDEEVEEW